MTSKISVVVPVYNSEHTLEQCVNSVLRQTYTDFHITLVDDGSKDKSGQICDLSRESSKKKRKNTHAGDDLFSSTTRSTL